MARAKAICSPLLVLGLVLMAVLCVSVEGSTKVVVEDSVEHQLSHLYGEDWEAEDNEEGWSLTNLFHPKSNETLWDEEKLKQIEVLMRLAGDQAPGLRVAVKRATSFKFIEKFKNTLKKGGQAIENAIDKVEDKIEGWFRKIFPKAHGNKVEKTESAPAQPKVDPRARQIEEDTKPPKFSDRIGPVDPYCLEEKPRWYYRTNDGSCNWLRKGQSHLGAVGGNYGRDRPAHFKPGTYDRPREGPNPRELSNIFFKNNRTLHFPHTPFLTGFVEFLVHELMYSPNSFERKDTYSIPVPKCDEYFDPNCTGKAYMPFWRTAAAPGTGVNSPRENVNYQTIWIDGSSIYGTTIQEQRTLRTLEDGKMKVDEEGYPPLNRFGFPMKSKDGDQEKVFAAGDVRANQDWLLMSYHTLFLREHNRLCGLLKGLHPNWDDERLFQTARVAVAAKLQLIGGSYLMSYYTDMPGIYPTPLSIFQQWYGETMLTINPLVRYPWKRVLSPDGTPNTLPQEFSIGYRWHDLIPTNMAIVDDHENIVNWVSLADTAFDAISFKNTGIESVVRGMGATTIPGFGSGTQDAFRNIGWNLGDPGFRTGFDLVAWAIEHERERGLPTYNEYIKDYDGKPTAKPKKKWSDFTSNPWLQKELARLYKSPDDVDITVAQELDEEVWPHTSIPLSMMIINFFTLFKGSTLDRFAVNYNIFYCFVEGTPFHCETNNALQDLIWEPHFDPVLFPKGKWFSKFWWDEFDIAGQGVNLLRNMVIQNTDIKCLQLNPLFTVSERNPVLCDGPHSGPPPKPKPGNPFT